MHNLRNDSLLAYRNEETIYWKMPRLEYDRASLMALSNRIDFLPLRFLRYAAFTGLQPSR